jgi:phospholipid/cholesterol/gamma-HCH transport system substrate-binding protein
VNKQAPSPARLAVIVGFTLSCFGILLFLWITFGGPTPLRAKTYEVKVPFDEATALVSQSDVRISGVSVGKVGNVALSTDGKHALATLNIDDTYAPLPVDTRATLRTKTLLGETYVELTPGDRDAAKIPDGGDLPYAQVAPSVQLDEILRAFDPKTRAAFRTWMQDAALSIRGRGQAFSDALGELEPTFTQFDRFFRVLSTQRLAVRQLFRQGAVTFNALNQRQGQLSSLIQNSQRVFQVTGQRDRDIEATFLAFPTFLDESRLTLRRLKAFALNTDPLLIQLLPAIRQLSPTLIALGKLAPQMRGFFNGLVPVIANATTGFSAFRKLFRDDFPPLLRALQPFLRNINPLLQGVDEYKHELTALLGNATAATNALRPGEDNLVYVLSPLNPASLATFPSRLLVNRNNAYTQPGAYQDLAAGLPNFGTGQCASGLQALLDPNTPNNPTFNARTGGVIAGPPNGPGAQDFFDRLKKYAFNNQLDSNATAAPPCVQQGPFAPLGDSGAPTAYQHTLEQPLP